MKQKLILAGLLLSQATLNAQPTITAADYPAGVGHSFTLKFGSSSFSPDPGAGGPNASWDFSAAGNGLSSENCTSINCNGNGDCAAFAGAGYYVNAGTRKDFYLKDATTLLTYGTKLDTTVTNYSNPKTLLNFPVTYNNTFNDNYTYQWISTGWIVNGSETASVDAYGTLKTPSGEYTNVLRVQSVQHDTYDDNSNDIHLAINTTQYDWYQKGIGEPVFSITDFSYAMNGGQQSIAKTYSYTGTAPKNVTAINELSGNNIIINVFPNPAKNAFIVNTENVDALSITVRSILGNTVLTTKADSKTHETEIRTGSWTKGIYFVEVKDNNGSAAIKKIVVN